MPIISLKYQRIECLAEMAGVKFIADTSALRGQEAGMAGALA